ncbi:MAG: hypothetical protein ABIQ40_12800 [Bacteroidia bacterium]
MISISAKSQGCSDAGLCSFGSLNLLEPTYFIIAPDVVLLSQVEAIDSVGLIITKAPDVTYLSKQKSADTTAGLLSFEFTSYYGVGEQNTSVFINQLEGNFRLINRKLYAQVKLPYAVISGNLGNTNGLGDVTMSLSYILFDRRRSNLSFSGGVKIPSNTSSLSENNRPLPMVYQTSLGSTDILLGSRLTWRKWDFTVGYQHSFNANENRYLHLTNISDSTMYNGYFESNGLRRLDDGLFRINRRYQVKKAALSTGILFIYHLQNDDITDASGKRVKAIGSKGLTINLNVGGSIPISSKLDFTFVLAKPVLQRKNVSDGLARSFVGIVGLKRKF